MTMKRTVGALIGLNLILCACNAREPSLTSIDLGRSTYFSYYWPNEKDESTYTFALYDHDGSIVDAQTFTFEGDIANMSFFPNQEKVYMYAFGGLVEYDGSTGKLTSMVHDDVVSHVFLSEDGQLFYIVQDHGDGQYRFDFYQYDPDPLFHTLLHTFDFILADVVVNGDDVYAIESTSDADQNRLYHYTFNDFSLLEVQDVEVSSDLSVVNGNVYLSETNTITDLTTGDVIEINEPVRYPTQLLKLCDDDLYSIEDPMDGTCILRQNGQTIQTFENCNGYQDVKGDHIMLQLDQLYYLYDLTSGSLTRLPLDDNNTDIYHTYRFE